MSKVKSLLLFAALISFSTVNINAETNNLKIEPYGYFKFDMAYDQARTNNGNYVFWVNNPDSGGNKDSEFNMTARQTRLGTNLSYEGLEGRKVTSRFEFDFYGGGAENKNILMMRHGYVKVDFGKYYLLAGQTSDVISPLVPTTVNYTVLWNCGNVGYRHPQVQFGNIVKNGIEVVGALTINIPGDSDGDGNDDGEDSSLPTVQARFSYINSKVNIGISGHYGLMEYRNNVGKNDDYNSYSLNLHLNYILTNAFSLKGEFLTGKTLNQYFGGIGQGFNYHLEKEVKTSGGWINASFKAGKNTSCNLGVSIDQPEKDKKLRFPEINYNRCIFGNVFMKIAHNTSFAIEISKWTTGHYKDEGGEKKISNLRFQTAIIFNI